MSAPLARPAVRRILAIGGLFCLVPVGRGLVNGSLTVIAAAQRAVVLLVVLWLLEHIVVPLVFTFAFPPHTPIGVGRAAAANAPTDGSESP